MALRKNPLTAENELFGMLFSTAMSNVCDHVKFTQSFTGCKSIKMPSSQSYHISSVKLLRGPIFTWQAAISMLKYGAHAEVLKTV